MAKVTFLTNGCYDKRWLAQMLVQMGEVKDVEAALDLLAQPDRSGHFVQDRLTLIDVDRIWKVYKNGQFAKTTSDNRLLNSRALASLEIHC